MKGGATKQTACRGKSIVGLLWPYFRGFEDFSKKIGFLAFLFFIVYGFLFFGHKGQDNRGRRFAKLVFVFCILDKIYCGLVIYIRGRSFVFGLDWPSL